MTACFLYAILYLAATAILGANEKSISLYLLEALADGNWWYTVGALVGSAAIVYGMYRLTCRRLRMRSFTR
jgi:hypothetical protein